MAMGGDVMREISNHEMDHLCEMYGDAARRGGAFVHCERIQEGTRRTFKYMSMMAVPGVEKGTGQSFGAQDPLCHKLEEEWRETRGG